MKRNKIISLSMLIVIKKSTNPFLLSQNIYGFTCPSQTWGKTRYLFSVNHSKITQIKVDLWESYWQTLWCHRKFFFKCGKGRNIFFNFLSWRCEAKSPKLEAQPCTDQAKIQKLISWKKVQRILLSLFFTDKEERIRMWLCK